ncbi:MAG: DNA translocase FtsK 4TM domain-containing protein, partial [Desulfovibrionales bacterium]|nr:DNA translocase FtsK 4TM domain-containing protein [Desulfovibrionales bacterium]
MKNELKSLLFVFLIILTAVSLFSFHPADPCLGNGFFRVPGQIHNNFGLVGAHVAGFFVFFFGMGAYWLPPIFALMTLWLFQSKSRKVLGLTALGGCLLMIATAGILYLFRDTYLVFGNAVPAGGLLGRGLTVVLLRYANIVGCAIVLAFCATIGFILTTGISLVALVLWVKRNLERLGQTMVEDFKA